VSQIQECLHGILTRTIDQASSSYLLRGLLPGAGLTLLWRLEFPNCLHVPVILHWIEPARRLLLQKTFLVPTFAKVSHALPLHYLVYRAVSNNYGMNDKNIAAAAHLDD
jgi:hypothetical protein